ALAASCAVLLTALSLPSDAASALGARLDGLLRLGRVGRVDPIALGAAAFATVTCAALAFWVWERHPHISDEISFLFQATYFAGGSLTAPGVPVPELFSAYQIDCDLERCLSVLQPGWPAVLALGVRVGTPWLVNPV